MRTRIISLLIGILLGSAACAPPPTCGRVCDIVVDTCGLGGDHALCEEGCEATPVADDERHDLRDCVAVADCGHLAAGVCLGEPRCGTANYYLAMSPNCFAGTRSVWVDRDCQAVTERGDWGPLGPPRLNDEGKLAFDGICTSDLDTFDESGTCATPQGDCDYLLWPVL